MIKITTKQALVIEELFNPDNWVPNISKIAEQADVHKNFVYQTIKRFNIDTELLKRKVGEKATQELIKILNKQWTQEMEMKTSFLHSIVQKKSRN